MGFAERAAGVGAVTVHEAWLLGKVGRTIHGAPPMSS
jgi:hypothetical protein